MTDAEIKNGMRVRLVEEIDGHWLAEAIPPGICGTLRDVDLTADVIASFVPDIPIEDLEAWGGVLQIYRHDCDADCHARDFEPSGF